MSNNSDPLAGLEKAAEVGDAAQVRDMLEQYDAAQHMKTPSTTLFYALNAAVKHDQVEVVRLLLSRGAQATPDQMKAALRSNASDEILQALVDQGVDVNALVSPGMPLIHFALDDERPLRFLLDHGADPNTPDRLRALTPLDLAAASYPIGVVSMLLSYGARLEDARPLRSAALSSKEDDRIPMMSYLINECHIDPNIVETRLGRRSTKSRGDEDCTPLQAAICAARKDRITFLLENGADPEAKSSLDHDAFEYAKYHEFDDGLELLEECLESRKVSSAP